MIYIHEVLVDESCIDFLGHVNNLKYLSWMIDAAVAHSADRGWPTRRYLEMGAGWVVRSHHIEYLSPAVQGDTILVETWISEMKKIRCRRQFAMTRPADGKRIAIGETVWTFVSFEKMQPTRVPQEVLDCFQVGEREA